MILETKRLIAGSAGSPGPAFSLKERGPGRFSTLSRAMWEARYG